MGGARGGRVQSSAVCLVSCVSVFRRRWGCKWTEYNTVWAGFTGSVWCWYSCGLRRPLVYICDLRYRAQCSQKHFYQHFIALWKWKCRQNSFDLCDPSLLKNKNTSSKKRAGLGYTVNMLNFQHSICDVCNRYPETVRLWNQWRQATSE